MEVGGGTTHSCSEFCLCGIGLGPNYCTFCRLSPINGHFLDQSSLLRSLPPLWLHLSQSRHSVGWRNVRPWGRWKDIFRQDGSYVSLTAAMRATWRLFSVLFRLFLSCWEYQKLTSSYVGMVAVILKENFIFKRTRGREHSFPFEPGPFPPIQWQRDWATLVPICFAAAQSRRLGYFLALGLRQAWVAYTLLLALISQSTQPIFK